jgi:uncharacterized protein
MYYNRHHKFGNSEKLMAEKIAPTTVWEPTGFNIMLKPGGAVCNLTCDHCYYLSKADLYLESTFRMSDALLASFTKQYIEAQHVPEVTFVWQGGEPTLLGLEYYRTALSLQQKFRKPGVTIRNSLQTNGTLINEEWAQFFKDNEFLVGISIDGPEDIHDRYRKDKAGKGSFDRVVRGLRCLQEFKVDFNILTCVSINNADRGLEVYQFFRDELNVNFLQFIPIVERDNQTGFQEGGTLTQRSLTPNQYATFLLDIFDEWVRHDVGKMYVQIFDTTLASWAGERPGLCIFEPTCGLGLVLEHNGDLYSCDHFVEPAHRVGNLSSNTLTELVYSEKQFEFGMAKRQSLTQYCLDCEWLFACHGGCPKNRVRKSPQGEDGQNYLCPAYKEFFAYVDKPMRIMANLLRQQKAPAEIMKMIAQNPTSVLVERRREETPKQRCRRH